MGRDSKIEWTDHTFNPWIGCTKVSPACKFCYAEKYATRWGIAEWGNNPRHKTAPGNWAKPLNWNRQAEKDGKRRRVFCASLADVFDDHTSILQGWRDELFAMIRATPNLDWLLLSKRPENYEHLLPADWGKGYKNVWLGVSIENQEMYDLRAKILSRTPAAMRFYSMESLLNYVMMDPEYIVDWIIIGGESGFKKDARRLDLNHVWDIFQQVDRTATDSPALFFKQLGVQLAADHRLKDDKGGTFEEYPFHLEWLTIRQIPRGPLNSLFADFNGIPPTPIASFHIEFPEL